MMLWSFWRSKIEKYPPLKHRKIPNKTVMALIACAYFDRIARQWSHQLLPQSPAKGSCRQGEQSTQTHFTKGVLAHTHNLEEILFTLFFYLILQPGHRPSVVALWRYQMETLSASLALCGGNPQVIAFPTERPVTQSSDVFFDLCLNKQLSEQSGSWWFETSSPSLWRHCSGKIGTWVGS